MLAEVEKPDGSYEFREMGDPVCGDYCDSCGDCLLCSHDGFCYDGGLPRWVIYKGDEKNPYEKEIEGER